MDRQGFCWSGSPTIDGCEEGVDGCEGVFVNPNELFIITDDLQVMPASYDVICSFIEDIGMNDLNRLQQKTVAVCLDQICGLLRVSIMSKSTLTDMFLRDQCIQFRNTDSGPTDSVPKRFKTESEIASNGSTNMSDKLIIRKIDKKIIYAVANEDFVNLLFSLLTFPVGLVVELLGGNSSLTCMDNMYKSVEKILNFDDRKRTLVSPKLARGYLCQRPLLDATKIDNGLVGTIILSIERYVKRSFTFMITDDLDVTPLSSISVICLLQSLDTSISCLEERVIDVGKEEAVSLLRASLISRSALTSWISGSALTDDLKEVTLKKPKQESHVP